MQSYQQNLAADANNYGSYAATAPAQPAPYGGYSASSTGGEYHDYTQNSHVPTSSYQQNSGSGYAAGPVHPAYPPVNDPHPHPHPYVPAQPVPVYHAPTYTFTKSSKSKNKPRSKKKQGDTTISALTLLSFFFFVNLLQNCLKEHMNTMNPTVMVMTVNGVRNRFNKLAEMNSREQNAAVASDASASYTNSPTDLHAQTQTQTQTEAEILVGQSPYSSDLLKATENNNKDINNVYYPESNTKNIAMVNVNKQPNNNYNVNDDEYSFSNQSMRPEFYDSIHSYRSRNYTTPKVFSSAGNDKSHNYSFQNYMRGESNSYAFDKTSDASLAVRAVPTTYWSLAGVTSSTSDFFQHHAYDDDDDDVDSYYAQHN